MKIFKGKCPLYCMVVAIALVLTVIFSAKGNGKTFAAEQEGTLKIQLGSSWKSSNVEYQQYNCTITNTSSYSVKNWKVKIPVSSTCKVSQLWNGDYTLESNVLIFNNLSYNGEISVNGTVTFSVIVTNGTLDSSKATVFFNDSVVTENTEKPSVEPTVTNQPAVTTKPIVTDISKVSLPRDYSSYISGNTYGTFKSFSYYSDITKSMRPANIILPNNYSASKKYPVLYMLHGIGGNQNAWGADKSCSLQSMAGNLISAGKAEDMIIVMPYIRVSTTPETNVFDASNYKYYDMFREELVNNLMPYMEKNYSIKTGRENTAVAGFSMGGRESLYIGVSCQDLFGYIGAFCPAPGIFENSNFDVYDKGLFPSESAFTIADKYKNNTVLMIVKGTTDTVVGDYPSIYNAALTKNKVPHYFYEVDGGHEEKVWGNGYYNFLQRIFGKVVE